MKAAYLVRPGTIEIRDVPQPQAGPGQVLVRVRAAGLNSGDRLQVKGFYPAPPGSPASRRSSPRLRSGARASGRNFRALS